MIPHPGIAPLTREALLASPSPNSAESITAEEWYLERWTVQRHSGMKRRSDRRYSFCRTKAFSTVKFPTPR